MLGKIIRENSYLFLTILLSIFAVIPLFVPGFFSIHDDEQIGRLYELDQALRAGQFPVRIIANLGFGFSYLLFNFYPPFVYYLGEFFRILSFSYIDSMKIVIGIGFIASAFFMYLFSKEYFGKIGAMVSAVLYTYAPYHSVDVYVRGALPEFFSFVFIPAILWSYKKLSDNPKKQFVVLASVFNFLLVLTHNLVAMMASVFILVYLIFLYKETNNRKEFIKNTFLTLFFSALLSSYFFIPALLENKLTMVSLLTKELADYNYHFVYLRQLWDSPWGYGGSILGLEDGMSFQIGKIHIVASIIAFAIALFGLAKKKLNFFIFMMSSLLALSIFMQTFHSKIIWDAFPPLHFIQFPWRFLLFSVFFSSILGGFLISQIRDKKLSQIVAVIFILAIIALNKDFFLPERYLHNKDIDYISTDVLRWDTSIKAFEYVPAGIATKKSEVGNSIVDISKQEVPTSIFNVISGEISGVVKKDKPNIKELNLDVAEKGTLQLNIYAYPQWKVYLDGNQTRISSQNKLKLIRVEVPEGRHLLILKFEETALEKMSNSLSVLGLLSILVYGLGVPRLTRIKNEKT